eukprot:TRINITY_DN12230_c0_g1_i1.p3 TRINITY_DN12230_c0_g1~~TRINITY_DN12230_c0_g1_i1.p3  ORF type:complete len:114 (-),score=21.85 TRINITY_DN12230_c0_g1_i1:1224-1565(-)
MYEFLQRVVNAFFPLLQRKIIGFQLLRLLDVQRLLKVRFLTAQLVSNEVALEFELIEKVPCQSYRFRPELEGFLDTIVAIQELTDLIHHCNTSLLSATATHRYYPAVQSIDGS